MTKRLQGTEATVICPQCKHGFRVGKEMLGGLLQRWVEKEYATRRQQDLKQRAEGRVLELERAERLGELNAVRNLLVERRAMIATLEKGQRALRKEELALRKRVWNSKAART